MNRGLRSLCGPAGRRVVVATGLIGLLVTGVSAAEGGEGEIPAARPAPWAASVLSVTRLPVRLPRAMVRGRAGASSAGTRLLDQASTAARMIPYRGLQVLTWLAPGGGGSWLSPQPVVASQDVLHQTGQLPDGALGLTPVLVRLMRAHYAVVYSGPGWAAGRPACVVEALRRDGSVAARFWLDRATKLPLRRELFDTRARLVSVDNLAGLQFTASPAGRVSPAAPAAAGRRGAAGSDAGGAARTATRSVSGDTRTATQSVAGGARTAARVGARRAAAAAGPRWSAIVGERDATARLVAHMSPALRVAGLGVGVAASAPRRAAAGGGPATAPRPWADRLGRRQLAALRAEGWPAPAAMPGGLTLFQASQAETGTGKVVDLAYSDGLSVVSLFVQRGRLPAAMPGWRQTDLRGRVLYLRDPAEPDLTWSAGGYVLTVVAGAPAATLASVVDSLPHQDRPGFWSRLARGARRLLSWADPFR